MSVQGGQNVGPTQGDVMLEQQKMLQQSMAEMARNWVSMINTQKTLDAAKREVQIANMGKQLEAAYKATGMLSYRDFANQNEPLIRAYLTAMDVTGKAQDTLVSAWQNSDLTPEDNDVLFALHGKSAVGNSEPLVDATISLVTKRMRGLGTESMPGKQPAQTAPQAGGVSNAQPPPSAAILASLMQQATPSVASQPVAPSTPPREVPSLGRMAAGAPGGPNASRSQLTPGEVAEPAYPPYERTTGVSRPPAAATSTFGGVQYTDRGGTMARVTMPEATPGRISTPPVTRGGVTFTPGEVSFPDQQPSIAAANAVQAMVTSGVERKQASQTVETHGRVSKALLNIQVGKTKSSDVAQLRKASADLAALYRRYPRQASTAEGRAELERGVLQTQSTAAESYRARYHPSAEVVAMADRAARATENAADRKARLMEFNATKSLNERQFTQSVRVADSNIATNNFQVKRWEAEISRFAVEDQQKAYQHLEQMKVYSLQTEQIKGQMEETRLRMKNAETDAVRAQTQDTMALLSYGLSERQVKVAESNLELERLKSPSVDQLADQARITKAQAVLTEAEARVAPALAEVQLREAEQRIELMPQRLQAEVARIRADLVGAQTSERVAAIQERITNINLEIAKIERDRLNAALNGKDTESAAKLFQAEIEKGFALLADENSMKTPQIRQAYNIIAENVHTYYKDNIARDSKSTYYPLPILTQTSDAGFLAKIWAGTIGKWGAPATITAVAAPATQIQNTTLANPNRSAAGGATVKPASNAVMDEVTRKARGY